MVSRLEMISRKSVENLVGKSSAVGHAFFSFEYRPRNAMGPLSNQRKASLSSGSHCATARRVGSKGLLA